ncbi:unnamed protein product [Phaeothamnion confervicola]
MRLSAPKPSDVSRLPGIVREQMVQLIMLVGEEEASRPNTHFALHVARQMQLYGTAPETQKWERHHQELKKMNAPSSRRNVELHFMTRSNMLMALEALRDGVFWDCYWSDAAAQTPKIVTVHAGPALQRLLMTTDLLRGGVGGAAVQKSGTLPAEGEGAGANFTGAKWTAQLRRHRADSSNPAADLNLRHAVECGHLGLWLADALNYVIAADDLLSAYREKVCCHGGSRGRKPPASCPCTWDRLGDLTGCARR